MECDNKDWRLQGKERSIEGGKGWSLGKTARGAVTKSEGRDITVF